MTDILGLPIDDLLPNEHLTPESRQIKTKTQDLIAESHSDPSKLPNTLRELLTQIIKPLFTTVPNPNLTPSGRKLLVPPPPSLPNPGLASDHLAPQPWQQNPLTIPLLTAILHTYPTLPLSTRKATFEDHFYLLVPPTLNIIDHHLTSSKIAGYHLLRLLCEASSSAKSTILQRGGLTDVFVASLKTNFMMLPTLTPADESLAVMRELYPAFHALMRARFVGLSPSPTTEDETRFATTPEISSRIKSLTLLLRHAVLAGLSHLSAGTSSTPGTQNIELTTFLTTQLRLTISALGVYAVRDLNAIIPMMRGILMDPFVTAAPELLLAALEVLDGVCEVCAERVREKWWEEVLRGLVGCWCVVLDEEEEEEEGVDEEARRKGKRQKDLSEVSRRLKGVTRSLGQVVSKDEWQAAKEQLLEEEEDLEGLFEGT